MSRNIVAFTTMKNEGPFLLEWFAFHRSLGMDHILIYTNDCNDGTDAIAKRLTEMGIATHVDNAVREGGNPQHQMLRRARNHERVKAADWLMCLDADEFLNIRVGARTINGLIDATEDKAGCKVDAISVAWKLFGSGGNLAFEDGPVTSQFTLGDTENKYHSGRAFGLKTLFRNNGTFERYGPHRPKQIPEDKLPDVKWSDAGGLLFPADKVGWRAWRGFDHSFARLHHYSVRSLQSFLVKRDRGRTNHINVDQAELYWTDMNANKVADRTIWPLADAARPQLDELLADPVLADLHKTACNWHQSKITELENREDWQPFRQWLRQNLL